MSLLGQEYYGKRIIAAKYDKSTIYLLLEDGCIAIDDRQSCCETRYFHTEDNLQDLVGHRLAKIEVKCGGNGPAPAPRWPRDYVREISFLEIQAGHETVTFTAYNIHNGYYGSCNIEVEETEWSDKDG